LQLVMRGQKRVEDARKRAYDPRIHLLRKTLLPCSPRIYARLLNVGGKIERVYFPLSGTILCDACSVGAAISQPTANEFSERLRFTDVRPDERTRSFDTPGHLARTLLGDCISGVCGRSETGFLFLIGVSGFSGSDLDGMPCRRRPFANGGPRLVPGICHL
jgi:hypothetical protein